jgi:type IV pilus assembly protein PilV
MFVNAISLLIRDAERRLRRKATGFTMIEVLVTLVILMIGLLGIAGLMAQGQRTSFEAYQRQQALALANDVSERIKANRQGVDNTLVTTTYDAALATPAGTGTRYAQLIAGTITNCATSDCTPTQTVLYDLAVWDGLLEGSGSEKSTGGAALGPIIAPRGCVASVASTACVPGTGAATSRQVTYRVSVAWQGNYGAPAAPVGLCGAGTYRNAATGAADDTWARQVSVDVFTVIPCP